MLQRSNRFDGAAAVLSSAAQDQEHTEGGGATTPASVTSIPPFRKVAISSTIVRVWNYRMDARGIMLDRVASAGYNMLVSRSHARHNLLEPVAPYRTDDLLREKLDGRQSLRLRGAIKLN